MTCPCGSQQDFEQCCEPYIKGLKQPQTAEVLMRSRYTAYASKDMAYIKRTLAQESIAAYDPVAAKEWADKAEFKSLRILSTEKGGASDKSGTVEFVATFTEGGETLEHHEVSQFKKNGKGEWRFVDGDSHTHKEGEGHHHHHDAQPATIVREGPKVGRNDPCPCGSGKKFKKCHG